MRRCLHLAGLGAGHVAPNPMVGAVLVYEGRIIGEGYHRQYGEAHAEVNCIQSAIDAGFGDVLGRSTIYVSLEPCAHFGKTPPCADLIIRHGIPNVVIGCRDPFEQVNGKGVEKLLAAGVNVINGILEAECRYLNRRFFTFHLQKRPYVILKWAETADGFLSQPGKKRLLISNEYSNRQVHKWRSEEAGILIGSGTALADDPELTTRLWPGPSPVRIILDRHLQLPSTLRVFDRKSKTIVLNRSKTGGDSFLQFYKLPAGGNVVQDILQSLYDLRILSVLVEGGRMLLQSFVDDGTWDQAHLIRNRELRVGEGLPAPKLSHCSTLCEHAYFSDTITTFEHA
jgi:diaminohydroxyphosphoribosylaminopyrimidine deaminase/5-amino-6-(5-phosphoribosylamino)uracil reductase